MAKTNIDTKDWFKNKSRRHHNKNGLRQIKNGKTEKDIKRIAKKLGIRYKNDV